MLRFIVAILMFDYHNAAMYLPVSHLMLQYCRHSQSTRHILAVGCNVNEVPGSADAVNLIYKKLARHALGQQPHA